MSIVTWEFESPPLHLPSAMTRLTRHNAAIAQLVEHNLAKVGVAGSSPVCRSNLENSVFEARVAQVAELVDAHVSGACV